MRWRPIPTDPDGEHLGDQIKYILGRELFEQDGSCPANWTTVAATLVPFLRGVRTGAAVNSDLRKETDALIELIRVHGEVQVGIFR